MKAASAYALVLVTAPDEKMARKLARGALEARLIACANLVPAVESIYWWQGKIESSREVLLVLKTKKTRLAALEKFILDHHPYETPEFLVLPIQQGSAAYLKWVTAGVESVG